MTPRNGLQLLGGLSMLLLAAPRALVAATTAPSLYDYEYDGKTTYCYWLDQGMQVANMDFAYVLAEGKDDECPLTIAVEQTTTGTINANDPVEYAFTATLDFSHNVFNMLGLQGTVPDPTTGLPMQIGHANLHSCLHSSVCDIFRRGTNRKISDQETSNFTSAGTASFRQKITYLSAGERTVFAHIILPPTDYLSESYHFMTFLTTAVESSTAAATPEDDDAGLSTNSLVGIIVGAVIGGTIVVVAIIFWRRKNRPTDDVDRFRRSGFGGATSRNATKAKSRLDWDAEPEPPLAAPVGWKDNYAFSPNMNAHTRGPGLNASSLAFNDRLSHHRQKTASSSGSMHSRGSSGIHGDNPSGTIGFNSFNTPSNTVSTIQMPQRTGHGTDVGGRPSLQQPTGFDQSASSVFNDGTGVYHNDPKAFQGDDNLEYGRTPDDFETYGLAGGQAIRTSYESDASMGTSFEYNGGPHLAGQPFNPLLSGYSRDSDMSSMNEYDMYEQPPPRARDNTMDAILTAEADSDEEDVRGGSESSMGTVDFTMDEPNVRRPSPNFAPLDETSNSAFSSTVTSTDTSAGRSTGIYDFDDASSFRPSSSFASTNTSDLYKSTATTGQDTRNRRTSSDGESYEF